MSKSKRETNPRDVGQLNIFDLIGEISLKQAEVMRTPLTNGKASIEASVSGLITSFLNRSSLSRYEVAARISEILGVKITKMQLDAWSAENKKNHRLLFVYTAAFCEVTGAPSPIINSAELCGEYYFDGMDDLYLTLGRIEERKAKLLKEEQAIRSLLWSRT